MSNLLDEFVNSNYPNLKNGSKKYMYLSPEKIDIDTELFLEKIENVFNKIETDNLIKLSELSNYSRPYLYVDKKGKKHYEDTIRDCLRCIIDSTFFANLLEKKLDHVIPKKYKNHDYMYINPRMRFLKYDNSGHFCRHQDENFTNKNSKSLITVLIYLNDGYEGGFTQFFSSTEDKIGLSLVPQIGMVCLMDQSIEHQVPEISKGIKYVVRTELMYKLAT